MPTVKEYQRYIEKANEVEDRYGIPNNLLVGLLKTESAFNKDVISGKRKSSAGAIGIAQFMPNTAKEFGIDPTEPFQSIEAAGKYLADNYKKLGNWDDTLRSYNLGLGGVNQWKAGKRKLPKETQDYVGKVYKNAKIGKQYTNSPTPISDQAISNVNTYFQELPTTDVKDLPVSDVITTFDTEEEKVAEDKDIEEVKAQTKEYNFLKEYKSLLDNQQAPQQEIVQQEVIEQQPQQSLTDIYNQVSQFIDTPIFAQQGRMVVNDPRLTPRDNINNKELFKNTKEIDNAIKDRLEIKEKGSVKKPLSKMYSKQVRENFPNKETKQVFDRFKEELNPQQYEALLDIQYQQGNPSVNLGRNKGLPFSNSRNYNPFTNEINVPKNENFTEFLVESYIQEASHANNDLIDIVPQFLVKDVPSYLGDFFSNNKKPSTYDKKGTVENDAHSVVEPRLRKIYSDATDDSVKMFENYNNLEKPHFQTGGTIGNLTPEQTTDVEKQRQWSNYWNSNRVIDGQKINSNSDIPFSSDIYIDDLNYGNGGRETTLGEFDNVSDRLILDTNYQSKPGIPVHEFTHRYQKYLPSETYSKYINQPISSALSNTAGSSEYHGNVDENQAELNRLRYNVGFKPDQVITPQDLQKYNADDYNLKHFSQDQLINLLNTTAYNESQDQSRYAQQGEIVKDQEGQRKYPNRVTEIQGNTMSTEGYGNISLYVVPDIGDPKIVEANTGEHIFPEATKFTEYPLTEQEKEFLKHISKLK